MWLLTAVGAVHGQNHFTYVLEKNKVYTIGRDRACDIRFEDKSVRPREWTLNVADWDPTNPTKPPELLFKVEPKKDGSIPLRNALAPLDDDADGSIVREHYEVNAVQDTGVYMDDLQGLDINAANWFFVKWVDVCLQYDQMKDEPEETKATLGRYCVAYTESFNVAQPPNLVISQTYQSSHACGFAICFGVRILSPAYLHSLLAAINASWKQVADSQDSFKMPDETIPEFRPPYGSRVPAARQDLEGWLPDPRRRNTFAGWKIMGLRHSQAAPAEKKFMIAMGAEWDDICVTTPPIMSSKDTITRISSWLKRVEESGDKEHAIVVAFHGSQKGIEALGVDWDTAVVEPTLKAGVRYAAGTICWGSTTLLSVEKYLEEVEEKKKDKEADKVRVPSTNASAGPSTNTRQSRSPEKSRAAPVETAPEPSFPSATPQALKVPSTFPDESVGIAQGGQSSTERSADRARSPEHQAVARPAPKPLKRRVGKPITKDLFSMDIDDPSPSTGSTPHGSQGSGSGSRPPSQSIQLPSAAQPSVDTQSVMPSTSEFIAPKTSHLKRRAGQPSQPFEPVDFAETGGSAMSRVEETPQEIKDLYEATKRGHLPPASKRSRVVSSDSARHTDEDSQSSAIAHASPPSHTSRGRQPAAVANADGEDIDMEIEEEGGEHEDFVQKTLREVAANRRAGRTQSVRDDKDKDRSNMLPPKVPVSKRGRKSPSEEVEVVESSSSKRPRLTSPEKSAPSSTANGKKSKSKTEKAEKSNEPTTDPAFLLAVSKSRSKKAIDEMDKEFNNLKIPKAALRQQQKDMEKMYVPRDYGILDDFEDDLRGNFIQVVRKDLYRKDGGLKVAPVVEDGRPNFKKFQKKESVRRTPLPLVLVGPNNSIEEEDEMGEPYWPGATGKSRTQMSQTQALNGENEDSLPLLPRGRARKLLTQNEEEEEDDLPPLPSTNHRRLISDSQASAPPASRTTQRKTRAASTISEAESVASAGASTRGSRSGAASSAKSSATVGRGKKTAVIVIDDSDEDETGGVKFSATDSGSRTGGRSGVTGTASRRTRGTTDDPPPSASASVSATTSASKSGRSKAGQQPTSTATVGRRKLLVADDDDDEMVYQAAPKKRRLG